MFPGSLPDRFVGATIVVNDVMDIESLRHTRARITENGVHALAVHERDEIPSPTYPNKVLSDHVVRFCYHVTARSGVTLFVMKIPVVLTTAAPV